MLRKKLSPWIALTALAALPAWSADTTSAVIVAPAVEPQVVIVDVAPPPLRTEDIPAAREGYTWAPGYWSWNGASYAWVDGHYVQDQQGSTYVAPRWESSNGRYSFYGERWDRDPARPNPLGNASANPLRPSPGQ
jgi:hypothetical protein